MRRFHQPSLTRSLARVVGLAILLLVPKGGVRAAPTTLAAGPAAPSAKPAPDCYLLDGGSTLAVALAGVRQGTLALSEGATDLHRHGQLAYAALRRRGVAVIDISDPAQPQRLADLQTDDEIVQIAEQAGVLELRAAQSRSRWFFSLAEPRRPRFLRRVETPGEQERPQVVTGPQVNVRLLGGAQLVGYPIVVKPREHLVLRLANGVRYTVAWSELLAPLVLPGYVEPPDAAAPALGTPEEAPAGAASPVLGPSSVSDWPGVSDAMPGVFVYLQSKQPVQVDYVVRDRPYPIIEQPRKMARLLLMPDELYRFRASGFIDADFKLRDWHNHKTLFIDLRRSSWLHAGIAFTAIGGAGAVTALGSVLFMLISSGLTDALRPLSWTGSNSSGSGVPSFLITTAVLGAVLAPTVIPGILLLRNKSKSIVQIR